MGYIDSALIGLHSLLDGHASLAVYGTDLQVFLGPPLDRTAPIEVLVGSYGLEAEDDGTSFGQAWATLGGGGQREKTIDIPGCVWVIGGETDTAAMVERLTLAGAVFAVIETALHSPTEDLGIPEILCGGVELIEGGVWMGQTAGGASVAIRFIARATARQ